ncbi:uncharacterized protein NDAI_0B02880 [Naumovozyma dairenensis CBS 421]|uniref:Uncharacterized protein n=1 Tax=Naumovozyma dairenensis (strain ATCC 10597 / BCRC 20456 / CBS 421 / NBRC 0211 / NRRL Y-12639) TaxID=1071378 RepID=G0W6B2_NAUDC|nr:hypothetical protein NDAI_0B02880 [Naumovozyma dairenensis CBS 421]CCD23323.1 hypothetical protein NDAI_0B02880 [Naumovozyma dairenensis CBS 421]
MSLTQEEESDTFILSQIHNLSYDGKKMHSSSAITFVISLEELSKFHSHSRCCYCETLLQGLKGPYKTMQLKDTLDERSKIVSSILEDIQRLYHLYGNSTLNASNKTVPTQHLRLHSINNLFKNDPKGLNDTSKPLSVKILLYLIYKSFFIFNLFRYL